LLVAFIADTVARRRTQPHPASASVRFGSWAIDLIGFAIFFFAAAFLLDLLGGQTLLHPLGLSIGQPYVMVDLNQLFHIHLADPASTLQGLNLVLGLGAIAAAFGLLTTAGVVLPSSEDNPAYAADIRSFWRITRDSFRRIIASLRLVAGPLVWLIPAFCVAMFASHVAQYFNASARAPSSLLDLFNPLSAASRGNITLGISTLLLGVIAVAAMVVAIAMLEASTDVIRHVFATYHDAIRAIALTWALFMYSLAAINAAAILLGMTKIAPMQVGAPGLIALLIGFGFLVYETLQLRPVERSDNGLTTAPVDVAQQPPSPHSTRAEEDGRIGSPGQL
jgi:hypothetical protein